MNTHTNGSADDPQKSDVSAREEAMLAFWDEHDTFKKSLEKKSPKGDFVFYDGPPFATGLPHYGHILAGTIKDTIPRFWTMNGYRVERTWGWDCHGLPLENIIEKRLGLGTKRDIEEYGIQNFNEAARSAVMEYASDWRRIIPRLGRWVDMDDDYKTMDPSYTESVWWVFKTLHEKGLVYEGFKSMHLCPRCGTTLSNFEVNLGYKDIKDIAVTVKLPLLDEQGNETDTSLLVWTTTPWTLPGNMAAAVHEEGDYVKIRIKKEESANENLNEENSGSEHVILAKTRLEQVGDTEYEVVEEMKGADLVGRSYVPPFLYWQERELEHKENAWKIYHAPYVELEGEGTGAVHLAPAYGEEDMELAKEHGIPIAHHVDEDGRFMDFVTDFAGQLVKPKDDESSDVSHLDTDIEIVKKLKSDGTLFKKENVTHSYPHCWRCDTPLLNYATTSWFVEVTKFRDELVAENKKVHWVPEHVGRSRFGKWLEGARDWAVSRQRYWGAPLPIWRNPETKEITVIGSLEELKARVPKSGNTYLIMRHGEAESNVTGSISAQKEHNDPLTEKGTEQVKTAAEELKGKGIDLIIHSGFIRTKMTAELVAETLGVSELIEDERIQELQMPSEFEGKHWSEYNAQFPTWEDRFTMQIEGTENRRDMQKRTGEFIYDLDAKYTGKTILIVGHAGAHYGLTCAAAGADIKEARRIHDEEQYLNNAEVRALDFVPLPHNDNFELDLHRPYIDNLVLVDEQGTKLERIGDVFDCWFESGSMPYAQFHYPFENKADFEKEHFPANFIAESIDQTRGWFYSLIVLGVALFGKSPYKNVITNGLVLAEDGRKMSKSLQNYPDPMELVSKYGADSMRFYLLSSSIIKGEDLNFSEQGVQELQRKNIGRLHNVLALYELYANDDAPRSDSTHALDRWIVARLSELVSEVTAGFENYELDRATRPVTDFIDDLSVWYVRRSRDRLKGTGEDAVAARATLRYVLRTLALTIAPSMPLYGEYLWQQVKTENDAESVHLADWPKANASDPVVLGEMSIVREFVTLALEARATANIKIRQPLPALRTNIEIEPEYAQIVMDEVNVKAVVPDTAQSERVVLDTALTPELKAEGDARELIRTVQDMRKKAGLAPQDCIALTISTTDDGKALVEQFAETIKQTVGADELAFGENDGVEKQIGEHTFTLSISKR